MNCGGCNACDIETVAVFTPKYDVERFGIKLVGSPRHADVMAFSGPVTARCLRSAINALRAIPRPRVIIALGSCACGGGIWHDTYSTIGGIDKFVEIAEKNGIKVDKVVYVPGCPPKPEAIIHGIMVAIGELEKKWKKEIVDEREFPEVKVTLEQVAKEVQKLAGAGGEGAR